MNARLYKYFVRPMMGLLVFVCCILILLHTGWGLNFAVQSVLGRLSLFDHATLEVDHVSGWPFSRLTLEGIHLRTNQDSSLVDIEQASVGYALWPMLRGEFHFSDVDIVNPSVTMRQDAKGAWDLFTINDPSEDTASASILLTLDRLKLGNGAITAKTYALDRDSTYRVTDLEIDLQRLMVAEALSGRLDLLQGNVWAPHTPHINDPIEIALIAAYEDGGIQLDSLSIQSDRSFVVGRGRLFLSLADSLLYQNALTLTAAPLAFDDIRLFAPGLAPGHTANIDLEIGNTSERLTANAAIQLSDGARLSFDGDWQQRPADPGADGTGHIIAAGKLEKFNPGLIIGGDAPTDPATEPLTGNLNAAFSADLTGQFDALSGVSNILFYNSRIAAHTLDSTRIDARFNQGTAQISLRSGLDGASFTATGSITPFSENPDYDIKGRISQFDLATFVGEGFTSNLNATFDLAGTGFSPEAADTRLSLEVGPSRVNRFEVTDATLTAYFADQRLRESLTLQGNAGSLSSTGAVALENTFRIDSLDLAFENFDFAALISDSLQGVVSGRARLNGSSNRQGQAVTSLTSEIQRLQFNQITVEAASLTGSLSDNSLAISSAGNINDGTYLVEGLVRLGADTLSYEITHGAFRSLNIGAYLEDSAQTSDLNGTFFMVGQLFASADTAARGLSLSGQVELEQSTLNRQRITSSTTWIALQTDTLRIELDLDTPQGGSSLAGWVYGFDEVPSYRLSHADFNSLDVGKLAGIEDFSSNLNGSCSLTGRGKALATLEANARCTLQPSRLNRVDIREGEAAIEIANNAGSVSSTLLFEEGKFMLNAETSSQHNTPVYQFEGEMDRVDIAGLLGLDSTQSAINLSFAGRGTGLKPEEMSLAARASGQNSRFQDIQFNEIDLDFHLDEGLLTLDTLAAVSNIARFAGSGVIAVFDKDGTQSSSFTLETELLDLAPLEEVLPVSSLRAESGTLRTRVFGQAGTLRMDTRANVAGFVYNTFHVGEMDARLTGEFNADRSLHDAVVTGQISAVSIPGFLFEEINFEATYDSSRIAFETDGRLDKDRRIQVTGGLIPDSLEQTLTLDQINLNLDEDHWTLERPARFVVGDTYLVENFKMVSGNQHIGLHGIIDLAGRQDMELNIENFKVGTVADLLGLNGLDGPLTTRIELLGPADAPLIQGTLDMDLIAYEEPVGKLNISIEYDSLQLNLDASLSQQNRQGASLKGLLPLDLSLTTPEASTTGAGLSQNVAMAGLVDFAIDADSMAIDWILPFIDPAQLDRLEGALTAHINIGGTAQDPTLEGTGRLTDGRIRSPLLGVTYENLASNIALRDNLIELTDVSMTSGEGYVSGNGSIELSDLTNAILNLNVTASQFLAIDTREYRATASGNMDLTGPLTEPVLNGDITVISADMFLDAATSSDVADLNVQLTQEDLLMLEREFGIRASAADTTTFDFLEALSMDIEVLFERDVWIRSKKNPEMNIQFSGELEVSKEPYGEYIAFGAIELIPDRSFINQFGKRFEITLGTLNFNGPATDPQLDFEALYEVPSRRNQQNAVTIYLDAEGKLDDLELTLSSDPSMELTDILSYIATGQPASEALQLGGVGNQSLASTGAGFALNQGVGLLTGAIESLIQDSGLELDVIQIEPLSNATGARVTAGKYVTPRIFTAVSQPIGASDSDGTTTLANGTVITLELELVDSLLLRLLGGESILQMNLLWHYSY